MNEIEYKVLSYRFRVVQRSTLPDKRPVLYGHLWDAFGLDCHNFQVVAVKVDEETALLWFVKDYRAFLDLDWLEVRHDGILPLNSKVELGDGFSYREDSTVRLSSFFGADVPEYTAAVPYNVWLESVKDRAWVRSVPPWGWDL